MLLIIEKIMSRKSSRYFATLTKWTVQTWPNEETKLHKIQTRWLKVNPKESNGPLIMDLTDLTSVMPNYANTAGRLIFQTLPSFKYLCENETFRVTVFVCSYGAQVESYKQKSQKILWHCHFKSASAGTWTCDRTIGPKSSYTIITNRCCIYDKYGSKFIVCTDLVIIVSFTLQ